MIPPRSHADGLRVASWNIHKGVRGIGPIRSLQIHNIAYAVERFDADLICLQEVRNGNRREQVRFAAHWPSESQAQYLAPAGYHAIYHTNAVTKDGEHGNALLSRWPVLEVRHEDMSDHRFEQRGLLHAIVQAQYQENPLPLHVIVVHLGLIGASRTRQMQQLARYIEREIPPHAPVVIAGDFNCTSPAIDWARTGLSCEPASTRVATFPARLPLSQLDHIFGRGLRPQALHSPRGPSWSAMSDHLPLIADFQWRPVA